MARGPKKASNGDTVQNGNGAILPAVRRAGWDERWQPREEVYFNEGRIIVGGKLVSRRQPKRAYNVLHFKSSLGSRSRFILDGWPRAACPERSDTPR